MLTDAMIAGLKLIAFHSGKSLDKIAAMKTLYRNGVDLTAIQAELIRMMDDERISPSAKVKVIDLLDNVNDDLNLTADQVAKRDEDSVRAELIQKYT